LGSIGCLGHFLGKHTANTAKKKGKHMIRVMGKTRNKKVEVLTLSTGI